MNNATQAEKREVLRNDSYHSRAITDADDTAGGRFAAINKTEVTGAAPAAKYPRAAGPWDDVRVPDEPPLGNCVDDLEPTGESFEVERSLASLAAAEAPAGIASCPPVETAAAIPNIKRRKF